MSKRQWESTGAAKEKVRGPGKIHGEEMTRKRARQRGVRLPIRSAILTFKQDDLPYSKHARPSIQ